MDTTFLSFPTPTTTTPSTQEPPRKHTQPTSDDESHPIKSDRSNSIAMSITSPGDQSDSGLDYNTDNGYTSSASNYGSYSIPTHPSLYPPSDAVQSPQSEYPPNTPASQPQSSSPTNSTTSSTATTGPQTAAQQLAAAGRRAPPATPPVPLACTECRLRHLKCDAGVPTCGRCRGEGRNCSYIKSRRGWKGRKRKGTLQGGGSESEGPQTPGLPPTPSSQHPPNINTSTSTSNAPLPGPTSPPSTHPLASSLEAIRASYKSTPLFLSPHELPPPPPSANLIQLYYAYIHASHPFILPPAYLIKTPPHMLKHLLPSMRFMGSFFAPAPSSSSGPSGSSGPFGTPAPSPAGGGITQTFRDNAEASLFRQGAPKNAWTVQALLLFAIGLHANNEQERASQVKDVAVEMALELGMNYEEFSTTAGVAGVGGGITSPLPGGPGGLPSGLEATSAVIEESWRRTWWELYYLDGLLAGIHQREAFRLWTVECTVPLPCEEVEYNTGAVPAPCSLQEFDDRYFSTSSAGFSSFAYRVEAVRILGQVLSAQEGGGADPSLPLGDERSDAADASLTNWFLHLPEGKKQLMNNDGKVDEMLFQAHMVINATAIYLHRPRSHLVFSAVPDDTRCTPSTSGLTGLPGSGTLPSNKPTAFHTTKTLHAADAISRLLTLPTPLIKHTPFFTCIITLSSIVHLSACSWFLYGDDGYLAKERIRLAVGALKTLEGVWGVAREVLGQVRGVAGEVFRLRPMWEAVLGPVAPGGPNGQLTEEEVVGWMEEDLGGWGMPGQEMMSPGAPGGMGSPGGMHQQGMMEMGAMVGEVNVA